MIEPVTGQIHAEHALVAPGEVSIVVQHKGHPRRCPIVGAWRPVSGRCVGGGKVRGTPRHLVQAHLGVLVVGAVLGPVSSPSADRYPEDAFL